MKILTLLSLLPAAIGGSVTLDNMNQNLRSMEYVSYQKEEIMGYDIPRR